MTDESPGKETRILQVMRGILVDVIKDTTTKPGLKHPLSDRTIDSIRHGLDLITVRQKELAEMQGQQWDLRPTYPETRQQQTSEDVVIPIDSVKKGKHVDNE